MIYSSLKHAMGVDRPHRIQALLQRCGLEEPEIPGADADSDRLSTRLMDIFRSTGDPEAYDLLFDLNQSRFRRMIGSRLRHLSLSVDAGDILQEAFFNIYRYPLKFRSEKANSFRVWMGAIVSNVIRRHLRRELERFRAQSLEMQEDTLEPEDPVGEPVLAAIEQEDWGNLRKSFQLLLGIYLHCYQLLSGRDREVLRLVEVDGLKYREVGRLLRTQPANVKMLVFRARQRLFRRMGELLAAAN